jgi:hypothetical protein
VVDWSSRHSCHLAAAVPVAAPPATAVPNKSPHERAVSVAQLSSCHDVTNTGYALVTPERWDAVRGCQVPPVSEGLLTDFSDSKRDLLKQDVAIRGKKLPQPVNLADGAAATTKPRPILMAPPQCGRQSITDPTCLSSIGGRLAPQQLLHHSHKDSDLTPQVNIGQASEQPPQPLLIEQQVRGASRRHTLQPPATAEPLLGQPPSPLPSIPAQPDLQFAASPPQARAPKRPRPFVETSPGGLTRALGRCRTWKELSDMYAAHGPRLNGRHVTALLTALAKVNGVAR